MVGVVPVYMFVVLGVVSARTSRDLDLTKEPHSLKPKDSINQWNILQVGSQTDQNGGSAPPGFVWVQVPVANLALVGNTQISNTHVQNTGDQVSVGKPGAINSPAKNEPLLSKPVTESTISGENLNKFCLKPKGQFPSKHCNKFVNCWNSIATEQACPEGLLFNPAGYCDYPEHVNCNGKPVEASSSSPITQPDVVTAPPLSLPTISASPLVTSSSAVTLPTAATLPPVDPALKKLCLKPRGQFPGTSCKTYVNCWDDVVVEQECPEGLLFSNKGYCDYAQNVECKDKGASNAAAQKFLECPQEFGTFRDRHDCRSYYTCVSYKIVTTFICPDGFKFSTKLGICDYQEKVDCSEETEYKMNVIPSIYNEETDQCTVKYGTFRDINNCSRYYTCVSFKIVSHHDCPPGYSFNDEHGICDYSYNVDCTKNRKIYKITSNSMEQLPQEYRDRVNSCVPGTVFRLNSQCTVACLCREGLAEIVKCPSGFAYDWVSDKCVLPHVARC